MDPFDVYKMMWFIRNTLFNHYDNFWKRLYYDDSYVFYKNAVQFYKNIQNGKFHAFFGGKINFRLYFGYCNILEKNQKIEFISDDPTLDIPSSDSLCNLAIQVINNLDNLFIECPRVPIDLVVYRQEYRPLNDDLIKNLKKGDFYRNFGMASATINPWYRFGKYQINYRQYEYLINFTILVPKYSKGYYINIPYVTSDRIHDEKNGKYIGMDEYELLLPRDSVIKILNITHHPNNIIMIEGVLVKQIDPIYNPIKTLQNEVQNFILTKQDIELYYIEKTKNLDIYNKIFRDMRNRLLKSYQLIKNPPISNGGSFYRMKVIPSIEINKWSKKKPLHNKYKVDNSELDYLYSTYKYYYDSSIVLENKYIYVAIDWDTQEKIMIDILKNNVVQFKYPIIFDETLDPSIYALTFIYVNKSNNNKLPFKDRYFFIDDKYPIFMVMKLNVKSIKYIPLGVERGFTTDINKVKIIKIKKKILAGEFHIFTIKCEQI